MGASSETARAHSRRAHVLPFLHTTHAQDGADAMSYRRFSDPEGGSWEAWEVHPSAVERRVNADRRAQPRDESDRRGQHEFRLVIPGELSSGWLAVQGSASKIRLAPIPDGWMDLSDSQLVELVAQAARHHGNTSGDERSAQT